MSDEEMQRSYYAILPANVRYDSKLTPNAKLLYAEITALTSDKGYCWASNDYFASLYGVSKVSVSKWINQLVGAGYLTSELVYKEGTNHIQERRLRIAESVPLKEKEDIKEKLMTPQRKVKGGIKEKLTDNIKYNIKDNNKDKKINDKKINDIRAERPDYSFLGDNGKTATETTTATATDSMEKVTLSEVEQHLGRYLGNSMTASTMQKLYDMQASTGDSQLLHSLTKELINKGYIDENDERIQKYNDLFFDLLNQYEYPLVKKCFDYSLKWALKAKDKITNKYAYFENSLVSNVTKIHKRETDPESYSMESFWGMGSDEGGSLEGTKTAQGGAESKGVYNS